MMKFSHAPIFVGLLVAQAVVQPLFADETEEVWDIQACRSIVADIERLHCYDTVIDGGVFNQQQVQTDNFGNKKSQADDSVDKLTVSIVRIEKSKSGIHYFYTSDEQVWKQVNRGNWSLEVPIQAEIKSGMMGSFFLVTEGGKSTRVKRVQ